MIKKARAYLNAKAVPILTALSLVLAVFSFSAGYKLGGLDWQMEYVFLREACAEELVNIELAYQARFDFLKKMIEQYLNRGRSFPNTPEPEQTKVEV